ncbi:MAG TPA: hypothetical protein VFD53_01865 [Ilumatobacter sp.]|nr:hypothetical protein [Ilumatobacter sp.]
MIAELGVCRAHECARRRPRRIEECLGDDVRVFEVDAVDAEARATGMAVSAARTVS